MDFIKRLEREKQLKKEVLEEIFQQGYIPKDIQDMDLSSDLKSSNFVNVINEGVNSAIYKQTCKFYNVIDADEVRAICFDIILDTINKHKILESTRAGQEKNRLYSDILTAIKLDTQQKVNGWTETIDVQENNQRFVLSPQQMSSIDLIESNDEGELAPVIESMGYDLNLFHAKEGYKKSEGYEKILDALGNKLKDKQKEIFHLVSITIDKKNPKGNYAEVGRMLKNRDIVEGRETRSSDKAYQKYVEREVNKIIKIIDNNIDIHNINKTVELEQLQEEIENLLDAPTETDILIYVTENINKYHLDKIVYSLDIESRKYLIHNFINQFEDEKLQDKQARKVCRLIVSALYEYIEQLKEQIKNINVINLTGRAIENKPSSFKCENVKIEYYVFKNKYEQLKKNKDITILDQQEIMVEYTRKYEEYRVEHYDVYYLGEFKPKNKEIKTIYGKINQIGAFLLE